MKDLKSTACQLMYTFIYESKCLKVCKVKMINRGYVTHYTIKLTLEIRTIVCVFFPFILDFNGRTSRGHTGRR